MCSQQRSEFMNGKLDRLLFPEVLTNQKKAKLICQRVTAGQRWLGLDQSGVSGGGAPRTAFFECRFGAPKWHGRAADLSAVDFVTGP